MPFLLGALWLNSPMKDTKTTTCPQKLNPQMHSVSVFARLSTLLKFLARRSFLQSRCIAQYSSVSQIHLLYLSSLVNLGIHSRVLRFYPTILGPHVFVLSLAYFCGSALLAVVVVVAILRLITWPVTQVRFSLLQQPLYSLHCSTIHRTSLVYNGLSKARPRSAASA